MPEKSKEVGRVWVALGGFFRSRLPVFIFQCSVSAVHIPQSFTDWIADIITRSPSEGDSVGYYSLPLLEVVEVALLFSVRRTSQSVASRSVKERKFQRLGDAGRRLPVRRTRKSVVQGEESHSFKMFAIRFCHSCGVSNTRKSPPSPSTGSVCVRTVNSYPLKSSICPFDALSLTIKS